MVEKVSYIECVTVSFKSTIVFVAKKSVETLSKPDTPSADTYTPLKFTYKTTYLTLLTYTLKHNRGIQKTALTHYKFRFL